MRNKELIKRLETLERKVQIMPTLDDVGQIVKSTMNNTQQYEYGSRIFNLEKVISIYKGILLHSGIIENCEASRTEYQWQEPENDSLGRNFHFKVNKVAIEKELE